MVVLFRDDDVNATTPVEQLLRLYGPFLSLGLPVNLSIIPEVRGDTLTREGSIEGFVQGPLRGKNCTVPVSENQELLALIKAQPLFCIAQHGLNHDLLANHAEFDWGDERYLEARIIRGLSILEEAGLERPVAFVAPQDRLAKAAMLVLERYFPVISGSWYELKRIPARWWPQYLVQKRVFRHRHFRLGRSLFLTHPGCVFAPNRRPEEALERARTLLKGRGLCVFVLHHWEFFPEGCADAKRIEALHLLAHEIADRAKVICFRDLALGFLL